MNQRHPISSHALPLPLPSLDRPIEYSSGKQEQAPLVRCATLKEPAMVTGLALEKASRLRSLLRCLRIGVPDDTVETRA